MYLAGLNIVYLSGGGGCGVFCAVAACHLTKIYYPTKHPTTPVIARILIYEIDKSLKV